MVAVVPVTLIVVGGAPENPLTPEKPLNPDVPEKPLIPEKPLNPDVPEKPLIPEKPENPDVPATPFAPLNPDVPEKPLNPDVPSAPDAPEKPENPDVPLNPENPDWVYITCVTVRIRLGVTGVTGVVPAGSVSILVSVLVLAQYNAYTSFAAAVNT